MRANSKTARGGPSVYHHRRARAQRAMQIVSAPYYPYETRAGTVYAEPVTVIGHGCKVCQYLEICRNFTERGGYVMCERIIGLELLPDSVIAQMEEAHV